MDHIVLNKDKVLDYFMFVFIYYCFTAQSVTNFFFNEFYDFLPTQVSNCSS